MDTAALAGRGDVPSRMPPEAKTASPELLRREFLGIEGTSFQVQKRGYVEKFFAEIDRETEEYMGKKLANAGAALR